MPTTRFHVLLLAAALLGGCAPVPVPESVDPGPAPRRGGWLGETPPGTTPSIFGSGWISTGQAERDAAWSPNGTRFLWSLQGAGTAAILEVVAEGGPDATDPSARSWSAPRIASFSGRWREIEPAWSPDGAWLYFASTRPLPGETEADDWNLWRVAPTPTGWADPEPVPGVNEDGNEFYPSLTRDGELFFTAEREGGVGGEDLFVAESDGSGGFRAAQALGTTVNTAGPEFNAFVSPAGDILLFGSARPGDQGRGDLYVSFRQPGGDWSAAVALPAPLNSASLDYCPSLSPDGAWLFFTSSRPAPAATPPTRRSLEEYLRTLDGPGNGRDDLYWVDASALEALRPPG